MTPSILYERQRKHISTSLDSKKRNMKASWIPCSTSVVTYALYIFLGLFAVAVGKCKHNEVEICFKDLSMGCFCRACTSCPPGYGPSQHCGGQYWNDTTITCVPCINGVTYSEEHSISSCQPCPQCGGKETLQKCTPKRETSCSDKCKKGYIMNIVLEDCIPDPSFMTTSQHVNTTAKLTTVLHGHLPKTTIPPNTNTPGSTKMQDGRTTQSRKPTNSRSDTSGKKDEQPNNTESDNHPRDNKIIILTTIGIAAAVFMVYFLWKLKKKQVACFRRDNPRNQDEEGIALTNKEAVSPRSSQDIVPWPSNLRLKDIKQGLRSDISSLISDQSTVLNDWRAIAEDKQLSLTPPSIRSIKIAGKKEGTSQGEELLKFLAAAHPELTVTKFVEILVKLSRKDVVEEIRTYFDNENKLNTAVQIEEAAEIEEPVNN